MELTQEAERTDARAGNIELLGPQAEMVPVHTDQGQKIKGKSKVSCQEVASLKLLRRAGQGPR